MLVQTDVWEAMLANHSKTPTRTATDVLSSIYRKPMLPAFVIDCVTLEANKSRENSTECGPIQGEFDFFACPPKVQLKIFMELYCARPWQLMMRRDPYTNRTDFDVSGDPSLLDTLQVPELRVLFERTLRRSKQGTLLLPQGCHWDIQDDIETLPELQCCLAAVTTLVLEHTIGSMYFFSCLKAVMPNLKTIKLGVITELQDRITRMTRSMLGIPASKNEYSSRLFTLDDLMRGEHDEEICDVVGKCLNEWIEEKYQQPLFDCYTNLRLEGRFDEYCQLKLSVGIPTASLTESYLRMRADFFIMDLVMEEGEVTVARKWFANREDYQYDEKHALGAEDVDRLLWWWDKYGSSELHEHLDTIAQVMSIPDLRKQILLLTGNYFNPIA